MYERDLNWSSGKRGRPLRELHTSHPHGKGPCGPVTSFAGNEKDGVQTPKVAKTGSLSRSGARGIHSTVNASELSHKLRKFERAK